MSQAPDTTLLCGRFRRCPPQLGSGAPPLLRPFDALLPVTDELSGRKAWLLPIEANFVGTEVERSYFMMEATKAMQLKFERAIAPAFVDRDEQWFWIGFWADDLQHHPLDSELCRKGGIVQWALETARALSELHRSGKQHGLLQLGSIVRSQEGDIRVWGGALYGLLNKERLAKKASAHAANADAFFVPAVLQGGPLDLREELHGWAMTVASRWLDVSGSKVVARLAQEPCSEGWARELRQLLNNCLVDPEANGMTNINDLVARLEVIARDVPAIRPQGDRRLQEFVPVDGSMPSLENAGVSYLDPRNGTSSRHRPVTSANTGGVNLGKEAVREPSGEEISNRPWIWLGVICVVVCAVVAGVWAYATGLGPFGKQQAQVQAAPQEPQGEPEPEQVHAPAHKPGPCPARAARLPGGACMDRFEYPGEGKLPRVSLTKNQASLLCEARQGRLCLSEEWRSACSLGKANLRGCRLRTGAKSRSKLRVASKSDCAHAGAFYDLFGNAAEWVQEDVALGGDAKTKRQRISCDTQLSAEQAKTGGFMVGFRCCYGPVGEGPQGNEP